ncbi:winged helix-turn-helix domain-containing protein [Methylocystis sp. WRRC1]|uniref:winged helix-turn-helix domain-containing protein n=1 Tax=Methylocystis sp. WRRC1 TaxID=1732014 RepID=UPI001D15CDE6|nr:winged helix-turn-helix domain-containing protein [Methylocystis sp. WRRC1]MCC3246318.1 winged helix-turn-helix domain-containing protein [Methylocystis sp. WRRC1]
MGESVRRFAGFSYSARGGLQRDGKHIHLGPQARQLLELLLDSNGAVVSRDLIASRLWPDRPASDESIDRCAYLLRKPLREAGGRDLIATSYGRGLSLRAEIEEVDIDAEPWRRAETSPSARILDLWQTAYELAGNRTRDGFERAQAAIAAAAELDPGSAPVWSLAADIAAGRVARGYLRPPQAAAIIEDAAGRALAIAPDFAPALAVLGWARGTLLGRPQEGLTLLDRAVADDPRYGKARWYRCWVLAALDRLADAIADTEEGLRASPLDQVLLSLQAWLTLCAGDREGSVARAGRGLELRPDAATLHLVVSIVASLDGRHEEAIAAARRGVLASPGDPFVLSVLAYAQARAGETAEAEATFAAATTGADARAPRSFAASVALALGREAEAVSLLERGKAEGCPWFAFVAHDPRLAPLRDQIACIRAA